MGDLKFKYLMETIYFRSYFTLFLLKITSATVLP